MATNTNAETVTRIYEAFGRGDVPYILAQVAPEVAWEQLAERQQRAGCRSAAFWEFGPDGKKVARVRHVIDTGKHVAAWRG